MKVLLLRYNKVTTEAFECFARLSNLDVVWGDLNEFGRRVDTLTASELYPFLENFGPIDAVMIGDIFWPTGQAICEWAEVRKVKCFFLQHGQWIYTKNKKSPGHLPDATLVYGTNLRKEIQKWPYARRSKVYATGNPRYDDLSIEKGNYVYFSPPVMLELNPSARTINHSRDAVIRLLRGLDAHCELLIQPHYREGKVNALHKWFPDAKFVDSQQPALPLVAKSRCVLTHRNSTMVLDGIACRKRIVLMPKCDSCYARGYFEPFAIEADSFADVKKNLTTDFDQIDEYDTKARPHVVLGGASERIEQIIRETIQNVRS